MYANLEIISNNTYKFSQFSYKVPEKLINKITIGTLVEVLFRNKNKIGVITSFTNKEPNFKVNSLIKIHNKQLNEDQLSYVKAVAITNHLNLGICLNSYIKLDSLRTQNKLKYSSIENIFIDKVTNVNFDKSKSHIFIVSSLKESKTLHEKLKHILEFSFYQKYGGVDEVTNYLKSYKKGNMILLNTNFEELIIKENSKYYIFNSNATSFRLPKLNNLNITESAYLKNLFFGGEFVFLNEFPNFEFNSVQNINNYEFDFDIEYFLGNTTQEAITLFNSKVNNNFQYYSPDKIDSLNLNFLDYDDIKNSDCLVILNPTISTNGVLNSYKLIFLMKLLRYFKKNKKKIYCISNKDLNISNSLYSKNLYKWIQKEVNIRKKYGPNLTKKIFTTTTDVMLDYEHKYLKGPIKNNENYLYELELDIGNDYVQVNDIFKNLYEYELKRVRFI